MQNPVLIDQGQSKQDFAYSLAISTAITGPDCINPLRAKFFRGNINMYLHFVSFLHIDMTQVLKILPRILKQEKDLSILYNQYHGCWCPGDVRSQGISSHDIDLGKPR